jgi:predicted anti-sigma-YlaC factor YlaD
MTTAQGACSQARAQRRLIDRHFRGRATPADEAEMRAHLPDCASCRGHYERHALLAELARTSPNREDRIALGLGLDPATRAGRRAPLVIWSFAGAAAAVGLAILVVRGGARPIDSEFTARGIAAVTDADGVPRTDALLAPAGPQLDIYRVPLMGGKPVLAQGWLSPVDELAFAFVSAGAFKRAMVFGVDDRGETYWFFPEWHDPQDNPTALPIPPGTGLELPEAVHHDIRGSRLRVYALFTNEPITVGVVEERVKAGDLTFPGSELVMKTLEVRR